jgi:cytidine deaminase
VKIKKHKYLYRSALLKGISLTISDTEIERLTEIAREASEHAYCPYSNFRVGAAIQAKDGSIFSGCNVENASYGLAICAERNAIFQAVAKSKEKVIVEMVVIYTPTDRPTTPCGACRQVINEFNPEAEILCICDGEETLRVKLNDLLPYAFGPENL